MEVLTPRAERRLGWIVLAIVITGLFVFMGSCAGSRTMQAQQELESLRSKALADGQVTGDEQDVIDAKLDEVKRIAGEEVSQWPELMTTGAATFLATLLGVRVWRGPSTKGQ